MFLFFHPISVDFEYDYKIKFHLCTGTHPDILKLVLFKNLHDVIRKEVPGIV